VAGRATYSGAYFGGRFNAGYKPRAIPHFNVVAIQPPLGLLNSTGVIVTRDDDWHAINPLVLNSMGPIFPHRFLPSA
jgi:hypothetical protein